MALLVSTAKNLSRARTHLSPKYLLFLLINELGGNAVGVVLRADQQVPQFGDECARIASVEETGHVDL